ncbi:tRNA (adenosine(37)-N6)-dimethylallyltransferase MiaA [Sphingomonas sp. FW199]|uniref:tRNA (adenosine(37)-N6)-dimethylallyltransferase MiaA n=1 Tax=Sphingomonas sp. FW199 TaxID=3400217 RepID=UPI003CFA1E74
MNMSSGPSLPRVALIAGPTASGKSAIALELARRYDGVVINADASQVYADLRILSARPTEAEEAEAPHRLFGHVDGADAYSAARYAADARAAIDQAVAAGRLPILVGGTGLYLRTLIDGIAPVPEIDAAIRAEVRAMSVAAAHDRLIAADPDAAARLHPGDTTRVARALEVKLSTGRTLAQWQAQRVGGIGDRIALTAAILLPDREWLAARCDARLAAMFDGGGVDEVERLRLRRLDPALPVMRAIGVPEIATMLDGTMTRAEAMDRAMLATRQYAKRQYTWFRNQPPAGWERLETNEKTVTIGYFETKLHH